MTNHDLICLHLKASSHRDSPLCHTRPGSRDTVPKAKAWLCLPG